MNSDRRISERWICVGRITNNWYFQEMGCGIPHCYMITWRGRVGWCQPWQFVEIEDLIGAARRRLKMAGLMAVAMASWLPRQPDTQPLWCLVRRSEIGDRR